MREKKNMNSSSNAGITSCTVDSLDHFSQNTLEEGPENIPKKLGRFREKGEIGGSAKRSYRD